MEIEVLNCENTFVPVFNNLKTPPYCLVKLSSSIWLDVYTITIKAHLNLMHVHKRVDLPNGTYTLTQEEEGSTSGELNHLSVQQDLDQSPEDRKTCVSVESEEGKYQFI
jgi:hypothetical protein